MENEKVLCPVVLRQQEQSFPCDDCGYEGTIRIDKTYDEYDCEDCGSSYSEGAKVYLNDQLWFELKPVAHCFGGKHWDNDEVFREILARFGYNLEIIY